MLSETKETGRHIPYDLTYMWNLENKQTLKYRELVLARGGWGAGEIKGIKRYTLGAPGWFSQLKVCLELRS